MKAHENKIHALMTCDSIWKKRIYTVPLNHTWNGEELSSRSRKTGVGLLAHNLTSDMHFFSFVLNLLNILSVTWLQQLVDKNLLLNFRKGGGVV